MSAAKDEGEDAGVAVADLDGVFPEGFYATTNFATDVRVRSAWVRVEGIEMDVGIRITGDGAEACPMHRVRKGDALIVGEAGVRVHVPSAATAEKDAFRFMSSSAIVHSGSAPVLEKLVREGWIDVLFAGNALAAHDIEAAMYGTSLGVDLERGEGVPHGHQHHLRAINRVRRAGSIAEAVHQGLVTGGVMHACITKPIPFVLAGSIRDDGPLPDVFTDAVQAADAMRELVLGVTVAIIVATTLHGVATGNMLPATVATFCVDSDADTVIKLVDRGTQQAVGIVTDCEYFLSELARVLV
jgi:hypothetical protein